MFPKICLMKNQKKNYNDIVYSRPSKVWENYFNNLTGEEHYQHYLNFNRGNIINLGVEKGFEIPFFYHMKLTLLLMLTQPEKKI